MAQRLAVDDGPEDDAGEQGDGVAGRHGRGQDAGLEGRLLQDDPAWNGNLVFSEYFHGDNGAAVGAAHQTGWTGLIADVIRRRHGAVPSIFEIIRRTGTEGTP